MTGKMSSGAFRDGRNVEWSIPLRAKCRAEHSVTGKMSSGAFRDGQNVKWSIP